MEFRKLNREEIDCRIGGYFADEEKGVYRARLLLYTTSRTIMNILDEAVGKENWSCRHYEVKGKDFAEISIYDANKNQWIAKSDCGTENKVEAELSESSNAFKRAAVAWGIARELYFHERIWVSLRKEDFEKDETGTLKLKTGVGDSFCLENIEYNEERCCNIKISRGKDGIVYPKMPRRYSSCPLTDEFMNEQKELSEEQEMESFFRMLARDYGICKERMLGKFKVANPKELTQEQLDEAVQRAKFRIIRLNLLTILVDDYKLSKPDILARLKKSRFDDVTATELENLVAEVSSERNGGTL